MNLIILIIGGTGYIGSNTCVAMLKAGHETSPSGETKLISERILTDFTLSNPEFSVALLSYSNPIVSH